MDFFSESVLLQDGVVSLAASCLEDLSPSFARGTRSGFWELVQKGKGEIGIVHTEDGVAMRDVRSERGEDGSWLGGVLLC